MAEIMNILLIQPTPYFYAFDGAQKANRNLIDGLTCSGNCCQMVTMGIGSQKHHATHENFLGELADRGITWTPTSSGVMFRNNGIEVYAARDRMRLCEEVMRRSREFESAWTLVSEDSKFILLEAALEANPSRVVCVVHTTSSLPFGPMALEPKPGSAEVLKKAAGVITVSKYLKGYVKTWAGVDAQVVYFPSYGDGPFAHFNNYDRGYVTMINPSAIKGISIFLEMAKAMPDVEFAAVPTWASMPEDVRSLEELPNMRVLKPAHMDKILGLTRVLVVPSLWAEAFGQVVVEAMLRGIPVMASDSGGLPEAKLGLDYILPVRMIERYQDYVPEVPEQDTRPWIETLRELLGDRQIYERLSEGSREKALEFVSRLGIEPFEEYLKGLSGREEAGEEMSEEKQRDRERGNCRGRWIISRLRDVPSLLVGSRN